MLIGNLKITVKVLWCIDLLFTHNRDPISIALAEGCILTLERSNPNFLWKLSLASDLPLITDAVPC